MKHFFGKKSRNVLTLILMGSLMLHVVVIVIFGTIKLVSGVLREETEFQAGPLEDQPQQQQQEFEVEIEEPTESTPPPRPDTIVVNNPSELDIPSLDIELNIDTSAVAMRASGSFSSGLDELREQAASINFFGASASGSHFAILMDMSNTGRSVFSATRRELLETLRTIRSNDANFMLIYFGGADAGNFWSGGLQSDGSRRDFTQSDFWFPSGISGNQWIQGANDIEKITRELQSVNAGNRSTWTGSENNLSEGGIFFRQGTQFWGALNAAYSLRPAPSTVFILVEPRIAMTNERRVQQNWRWYEQYGISRPRETEVQFIVGRPKSSVNNVEAVELMMNLIHGGNLSQEEIESRITYAQ